MTQLTLWVFFLGPWFVLLFLDIQRMKRFLSVAFFTIFLATIYWQAAQVFNWWVIDENLPFLTNVSAFNYGMMPVITILVFYFTFQNIWLFFGVNIVIDAFQAFVISPLMFVRLRYYHFVNMNNLGLYILLLSYLPVIYIYQRLYERSTDLAVEY